MATAMVGERSASPDSAGSLGNDKHAARKKKQQRRARKAPVNNTTSAPGNACGASSGRKAIEARSAARNGDAGIAAAACLATSAVLAMLAGAAAVVKRKGPLKVFKDGPSFLVKKVMGGGGTAEKADSSVKPLKSVGRPAEDDVAEVATLVQLKAELREAIAKVKAQAKEIATLRAHEAEIRELREANRRMARQVEELKTNAVSFKTDSPRGVLSRVQSAESSLQSSPSLTASDAFAPPPGEPHAAPASSGVDDEVNVDDGRAVEAGGKEEAAAGGTFADTFRQHMRQHMHAFGGAQLEEVRESEETEEDVPTPDTVTELRAGSAFAEVTGSGDAAGSEPEPDAWAGVPRGIVLQHIRGDADGSDFDFDVRSTASGVSGVSALSTVSAAQAALGKLQRKMVLMQRIKHHR